MMQQAAYRALAVEDVSVDGEGRVTITDPWVAQRLKAAKKRKPRPKPNTNCSICNTVNGCGPVNKNCSPNTVSNCGCKSTTP